MWCLAAEIGSTAIAQAWKVRHVMWLKIMGRVGWGAKAVIYALLGGLACDNAVGDKDKNSASPQVTLTHLSLRSFNLQRNQKH